MHRRRTALALSAALLVAAPLLTACGNEAHPGAAAVVDGDRITVAQLDSRVKEVQQAQRAATKTDAQYAEFLSQKCQAAQQAQPPRSCAPSRDTLQVMVLDRVLDRAAKDAGVTVSRKDVQTLRGQMEQQVGGAKALETEWLQKYDVAPSQLDASLRTEISAQKLYQKLGADPATPQGQAALWKELSATSKKLNIDLNPRYGKWDDAKSGRVDVKTPWLTEDPAAAERARAEAREQAV